MVIIECYVGLCILMNTKRCIPINPRLTKTFSIKHLGFLWKIRSKQNQIQRSRCRPGCKKNPSHVTIARRHEAYYFWCVLSMSIYWGAIVDAGVLACAPLASGVSTTLFYTATPLTRIILLFVSDTNIIYVVTFAMENIRTKAPQCLSSTWKNYGA